MDFPVQVGQIYPSVRLEVEYGDRRASAEIPVNDTSDKQFEHVTVWLSALAQSWEVR